MNKQQTKAFTLVELIIVITILAILATVGFMSFQSYTIDARDTNRITSLKEASKGLETYQIKNILLPLPDEELIKIQTGTSLISYQGYLGNTVQKQLRTISEIKDYKDKNYYTYSINATRIKYQLLAMLENNPDKTAYNGNIINKGYAEIDYENRYPYTIGNKVGIIFSGTTNIPLQETQTGALDLSTENDQLKVIFSNNTNSGIIVSTGSNLPEIIELETETTATSQVQQLLSGDTQTIAITDGTCTQTWDGSTRGACTSGTCTNGAIWNSTYGCALLVNGLCGTANGKARVSQTTVAAERCSSGIFTELTDDTTYHKWSCAGANGGTTASCSSTILKAPLAGTNTPSQTSITWAWTSGGGTATKYQWSLNGSTWTDKGTSLSHSETSLICNTAYSNRLVKACDDTGVCTGNTTLTTNSTTACAFACGSNITYGGFTYTTKLGPDGKCWTSTNMKHTPTAGVSRCYNNIASNCTTYGRLYDWTAATHSSVCPALGTGWALPTDVQWTALTNAGATGWTGNKLSGIVSNLPGFFSYYDDYFMNITSVGEWWTFNQIDTYTSRTRVLNSINSNVYRIGGEKNDGYPVVCIKN